MNAAIPEYPYRSFEISSIVNARKIARKTNLKPEKVGENGLKYDDVLDVENSKEAITLRLKILAGRKDIVSTYEAALILAYRRVRGVGFDEIGRRKRYKVHIPKGWHQNIIDPNLPDHDDSGNRHEELPSWTVTDFDDFVQKVCTLWNINLGREETLL
jgi:hypothetical protein